MRNQIFGRFDHLRRGFVAFTPGQKTVAIIGGLALVLASVLVFRWAGTPSYAPLFTNMAAADAAAVIDQLDAQGMPYQLADGGNTILVPREKVYDARIKLSAEGLPGQGSEGYSLLDNQSLSTSQFQEQTSYKRAIEGELEKTIEALDAVHTAVVHVALPQEKLFESDQKPTTASVLLGTRAGTTLDSGQVQAVVHLVASSVEGLDPKQVTVTDSAGQVLSAAGDAAGTVGDARAKQVEAFESRMGRAVTATLERVLGPGNSAVQVTADLNFDATTTQTTRYFTDPGAVPLKDSTLTETYTTPDGGVAPGGVVGPDGELDPEAGGATAYTKKQRTSDNAVGQTVEQREAAPGNVESLHVGVVLDTRALGGIDLRSMEQLVGSALGIDEERGDTVEVTSMPFDRSAEEASAAALAAAEKADQRAELMSMAKTGGLLLLVLLVLLMAWRKSRKRDQMREQATTYVVEQLRRRPESAPAVMSAPQATAELGSGPAELRMAARDEIAALVERQPEEVAQLLRGWLVEAER